MKHFYKKIFFVTLILLLIFEVNANIPGNKLSGRILDAKNQTSISGATLTLEGTYLWAISDQDGYFILSGVQNGEYKLHVSCLGYVPVVSTLSVENNIENIILSLVENTLLIDEVVVTAQAKKNDLNTTWEIGNDAFKHLQVKDVSDIAVLLPGGKTKNFDLTSERESSHVFSLRDGGSTEANAYFGTAVEVDGVRLGNNGSFNKLQNGSVGGVSTRNIAVENIDYIEVITGVPSVEYGDLNSGIVKIHTRKGATPWNISMSVNPRTQQTAFSKGYDLGNNRGVLNMSAEWTKATKDLTSPYTSYVRRGISANYSNTFLRTLKFEMGLTGNFGGMNTKDDPDAYTGSYVKNRDNAIRANTSLVWLLNKSWITNLKFDGSVYYNDTRSHAHIYNSSASEQPAVHATEEGYFIAAKLPYTYFADQIIDSKELDYAASLKYEWNSRLNNVGNRLKAGIQWKASGNTGEGEYYLDPSLAPHEYRPRPYSNYPFMHNVSLYAEENISVPLGGTILDLMAGLRFERIFINGTNYENLHTFSPRMNAKWRVTENFSIRGGWGITEKLPSYYVLYPEQQYRDIQTFGISYNNNESSYIYYTQPYSLLHNANLKWQRNKNTEIGIDVNVSGFKVSLVGYFNRTKFPYKYSTSYTPYSYNILQIPAGYTTPENPAIKVDNQTGMVYIRGNQEDYWTPMDIKVTDQTFDKSSYSDNGPDMVRKGLEMVVDFPEIKPIRTQIRVDGAYGYTKYTDNSLSYYYQNGWSHTSIANRSFQYVGIYANGGGNSTANGKRTHSVDANITAVTHIPRARLIVSCRLEASLVKRSQNLSEYNGREYAFNVTEEGYTPTSGSIYDGNSYAAILPVAYMDVDGTVYPFTETEASNPEFSNLIFKSNNAYTFASDGYDPYFSLNLSITKEIGEHVSLAFFANNFTNSRRYVTSYATGVSAIFVPNFYYGLSCRLKF